MQLTPPDHLLPGERALGITPRASGEVDPRWNRRLRIWAGRTLTADALRLEQRHRGAALALSSTYLAPGIVDGLELAAARGAPPAVDLPGDASDWYLTVGHGHGIAPGGEDVALPRPLRIAIDRLPVYDPTVVDPALRIGFSARPRGVGVIVLQPVTVLIDNLPADAQGACRDENDDAFVDRIQADGCRLVWFPWPGDWAGLPGRDRRFRNRLAHLVFARDAARDEGGLLPWEELGLPLGVVAVDGNGNLEFVDRHAVVRAGGGARVAPLLAGAGYPGLWQARVRQLADHLADLAGERLLPKDVEERFALLPPFGLLPRGLVDLATFRTDFFPATCRIQAVPIPADQLELVLESCAGLAPIDVAKGDELTLFVPVPARFYDPRLLHLDHPDPLFDAAVQSAGERVVTSLGQRLALRRMAVFVHGARARDAVPTFPASDPQQVPGEPAQPAADADEPDLGAESRTRLGKLRDDLTRSHPFLAQELAERLPLEAWAADPAGATAAGMRGLTPWIADLERRIAHGNDVVNFGFMRVQTDMYRLRQNVLGQTEATRLAVSPAVAAIAKNRSSYATQQQLGVFFNGLKRGVDVTGAVGTKAAPTTQPGADGAPVGVVGMAMNLAPGIALGGGAGMRFLDFGKTVANAVGTLAAIGTTEAAPKAVALAMPATTVAYTTAASQAITAKNALIGKLPALRTTTIAERLKDPPAPESKNAAVASRLAIIAALQALHPALRLDQVTIPVSGADLAVVHDEEFEKLGDSVGANQRPLLNELRERALRADKSRRNLVWLGGLTVAERTRFAPVLPQVRRFTRRPLLLTDPDLLDELMSGFYDPDPTDGDEAAFFNGSVSAQELAVSALRAAEGRIDAYERALETVKAALADLDGIAARFAGRLAVVDDELAEARHDLGVAQALRAEEQARVDALNARRREILDTRVDILAFARLRSIAAIDGLPGVALDHAHPNPVPAALAEDHPAPEELHRFLDAFRHAPLAWLPTLARLVERLDRLDHLHDALRESKLRAQARATTNPAPVAAATGIAGDLARVLGAWDDRTIRTWRAKATLDLGIFARMSWQEAARRSLDHLSLDDLTSAGRGRGDLARAAGAHLADLLSVAGVLHERATQVPAAVRLRWAEAISVFDRVPDLRDLTTLAGFAALDSDLRADLRHLVRWIYAQVAPGVPEALQLATDLVRVCILLACHAPVSRLITAHLPRATTVAIGGRIELALDRGAARLGMQVRLMAEQVQVATAVVEDLAPAGATVRIVTAISATLDLAAGTRALLLAAR